MNEICTESKGFVCALPAGTVSTVQSIYGFYIMMTLHCMRFGQENVQSNN